jgi:hypothetical protein
MPHPCVLSSNGDSSGAHTAAMASRLVLRPGSWSLRAAATAGSTFGCWAAANRAIPVCCPLLPAHRLHLTSFLNLLPPRPPLLHACLHAVCSHNCGFCVSSSFQQGVRFVQPPQRLLHARAALGPRPGDLGSRREHGGNLAGAMMDTQDGSGAAGEAAIELLAAAAALPGDSPEARQAQDRLHACREATPCGSPQAASSPPGTPGAAATPAAGGDPSGSLEVGCASGPTPWFCTNFCAPCCCLGCLCLLTQLLPHCLPADTRCRGYRSCWLFRRCRSAGSRRHRGGGRGGGSRRRGGRWAALPPAITASPRVACSGCQALCCTHDAMQNAL